MKTIKILALQKKVEELNKEIIRLNNLIKKQSYEVLRKES